MIPRRAAGAFRVAKDASARLALRKPLIETSRC